MQLGSQLVPDRPLDVGDEGELAVVLPLLTLDVVEGDVDDGNHHVDQDHVDGDGESEEDPGGQQVGILDVAKVELADAHGDGVLRRADDVPERLELVLEQKEEEAGEAHEHDEELDEEGGEALGGNSLGFLDRLTDLLKMGDGLKMSDFWLGMS